MTVTYLSVLPAQYRYIWHE